jgi:anaerobic selenocysteine-containing dehydrogenase
MSTDSRRIVISPTTRSVCPYDCPDACGLVVQVEDGTAVRVTGDPLHPFTRGTLCPKMLHYERTVHSPLRLATPLRRSGPKGAGEFTAINWEEAVQLITTRWKDIISRHGAEAILPYSYAGTMGTVQRNCGHAFFHRLGASRLARTICSPAKDAGWQAVMGDTPAPHPAEVEKSDLVVLWGINAAATSIHFLRGVQEARRRGARVWLIETYSTPTASVADKVVLVRPGTDGALALGMMNVLEGRGLSERTFISEHVQGYEEFVQQVLPSYPPSVVSEITGLPAALIIDLALSFGKAKSPFIRLGSGLSRYGNGAMTVRCISALPAVVGAYGKPGAGLFHGTNTGAAFAMEEVTRNDFMAAPTRIVNMNKLGGALCELDHPRIMGLYVYHSNPASIAPDQNAVLQGLSREDLFTVVHERFLTDTARYADIVLPATTSLEHSDIYRSYGTYCIQRARPAIPPVGQSRSNWDTFCALADAMGFTDPYFHQSADELIDRLLQIERPMREGIDTEALAAGRAVELRVPGFGPPFATPSGKVEIFNPREPDPFPRWVPPYEEKGAYPLRLMTAPTPYALNASFYEQEELRRKQGGMQLLMNARDAKRRGLADGQAVCAFNGNGEVLFLLKITEKAPPGVVVAEGVWWLAHAPGKRGVNALTSQRLTDRGEGSTFYDNSVDVRAG